MAAMKALLDAALEAGHTEAQAAALLALCERYGVAYDPEHYKPGRFGLPAGYVAGWVGGPGYRAVRHDPAQRAGRVRAAASRCPGRDRRKELVMRTTAITVTFTDGTERTVTVNRQSDGTLHVPVEDGVAHFGRNDGDGWREFFAAPLVNIRTWG